jgi:hypothetical protein
MLSTSVRCNFALLGALFQPKEVLAGRQQDVACLLRVNRVDLAGASMSGYGVIPEVLGVFLVGPRGRAPEDNTVAGLQGIGLP